MQLKYRKLRNKVTARSVNDHFASTAELRKSVEAYYKSLVDETSHNPNEIWNTVNKVLNMDKARMFPSSVAFNGNHVKSQSNLQKHSVMTLLQ